MTPTRTISPRPKPLSLFLTALTALALLAAAPAARAQTTVSGQHNNGSHDGYDATSSGSPYTVTSAAQFNDTGHNGFAAFGSTVTVDGGTFTGNSHDGLYAQASSSVTVNGGTFSGNGFVGLEAELSTTMTVNGGDFSGNTGYDLLTGGGSSITLYGTGLTFTTTDGLAVSGDATTDGTNGGRGTITGTLRDNQAPSTLTYANSGLNGSITLVNVPASVPEPSAVLPFAVGGLGLLGLSLRARKRQRA